MKNTYLGHRWCCTEHGHLEQNLSLEWIWGPRVLNAAERSHDALLATDVALFGNDDPPQEVQEQRGAPGEMLDVWVDGGCAVYDERGSLGPA